MVVLAYPAVEITRTLLIDKLFLRTAQFEAMHAAAGRVVHELNTMVEPGLPVEDPLL